MDVRIKCGDSTSNGSRYIQLPHFVTDGRTTANDERTTTPLYAGHYIRPKRHTGVLPKNQGVADKMAVSKVRTTQQLVGALAFATIGVCANFSHPSNCWEYSIIKSNISDVAVDYVDMVLRVKFGDFRLTSGRIIRLFGRPDPFYVLWCSIYVHFAVDQKRLVMSFVYMHFI